MPEKWPKGPRMKNKDGLPLEETPTRPTELESFVQENLPEHIREKESALYSVMRWYGTQKIEKISGKENIPQETALFIANHSGGETPKLIAATDRPIHIVAAEHNWARPLAPDIMKRLGMLKIRPSLSQLSAQELEKVILSKPTEQERDAYRNVASGTPGANTNNIRAIVATLASGKDVAMFTQGLFTTDESEQAGRRSYGGYGLIARHYKELTGRDIPIVPVRIEGSEVMFGSPFYVDKDSRMTKTELEDLATHALSKLKEAK